MKALVVNAEWDPRKCYPISEDEEKRSGLLLVVRYGRTPPSR